MKSTPTERDYLDRCQSLAVLGGTFDPIHMGHLAVADAVYRQLRPQRVLFIPCGQPAHKRERPITCAEHRYNMTALAVCEYPPFDISRLELDRPGATYTIDTARTLQAICPPGAVIYFIIGADALAEMLSWKDAEELLRLCQFVAVPRPGYDKACSAAHVEHLTHTHGARIHWLDGPMLDISSTDIRERFKTDQTLCGLVPKPVEDYARQYRLYAAKGTIHNETVPGSHDNLSAVHFEQARNKLRIRLSPKRFTHTMGVVKEAERLAAHYAVDIDKAHWAALLHDCAKEYSADKKRVLCKLWNVKLDDVLKANIDITHSLLGAESARRDFFVNDPAILQAIRYHTTGHKGMSLLDKIIMLADYTEPYRENWGPLQEMRRLSLTDINQALILGTEYTIKEEEDAGHPIHPWSLDALAELKEDINGTRQ